MSLLRRDFLAGLALLPLAVPETAEAAARKKPLASGGRKKTKPDKIPRVKSASSKKPANRKADEANPSADPKPAKPPRIPPPMHYVFVNTRGEIVREQHARTRRHPASLTKMMALYTVFQTMRDYPSSFQKKTSITVPVMAASLRHDLFRLRGLAVGRDYTAESLMVACGSCSCAISTLALAIHAGRYAPGDLLQQISDTIFRIGRTEKDNLEAFVLKMNANAAALGMTDTVFTNPIGTPDREHYSTAMDMVTLMQALQREFPVESHAVMGRAFFALPDMGKSGLRHTSRFLRDHPREVTFAKTGTTNIAGRCLAAAFNEASGCSYGVVIGAGLETERNRAMTEGYDQLRKRREHGVPVSGRDIFELTMAA